MSLQVWLPLTKDLRQQGLSNVTATNNGATYSTTGGKLGGTYTFNGSSNYLTVSKGYFGANYSYSLWFYTTSTSATQNLGCCRNSVGEGFAIFLIGGKIRIDGGGTGDATQWVTNYTFSANTWTHLTVTCANGVLKFYINGVYQGTKTITLTSSKWGTIYSVGASQASGSGYGNFLKGKINDVRIYDHALSEMEVKQLSQGLVLHYPLDRQGFGQENLLKNSHIKLDNNGYYVGTYSFANSEEIVAGETYTLSFNGELQDDSQTGWYFNIFPSPYTAIINKSTDKEGRFAFSFIMPENNGNHTAIGCYSTPLGNRLGCAIWNVKLEKGSIATPWCPNSSDSLATTMGLNSTTEYDCSGFCNNGTRTGTFTWTSDTSKYTASTYMPKTAKITHPRPVFGGTDQEWTCAMWVKLDTTNQSGQAMNNFNYNNNIVHSANGVPLLYLNAGTNDYYNYGNKAVTAGEWTHIAFVFKNSNVTKLIYINGVEHTNKNGPNRTSTPAGIPDIVTVGTNLAGYISDYRIYATALSAEDVKSLYQNCATIDPDGTIRGQIRS